MLEKTISRQPATTNNYHNRCVTTAAAAEDTSRNRILLLENSRLYKPYNIETLRAMQEICKITQLHPKSGFSKIWRHDAHLKQLRNFDAVFSGTPRVHQRVRLDLK